MVLSSICEVSYGSRNSAGVKMLRTMRSTPTLRLRSVQALRRGYNAGESRGYGERNGRATRFWPRKSFAATDVVGGWGRADGVPGAIFALYLFDVALIVKTFVQGE